KDKESPPAEPQPYLSKMEAMRRALDKLGDAASPQQIQDWVAQELQMHIPKNMVSSYKSAILRKKAGISAFMRPRPAMASANTLGGGISIADVQIIKDLTTRIRAAKLHELVDVLSRSALFNPSPPSGGGW